MTSSGEQSKKFTVDVVTFLKNMPFFLKKNNILKNHHEIRELLELNEERLEK